MSSLPGRVRSRLREAAESRARRQNEAQLADWTRPLVGDAPGSAGGADLLADSGTAGSRRPANQPVTRVRSLPADAPKCLLVTSQLGFGGLSEVVKFLALGLPNHGVRTAVLGVFDSLEDGSDVTGGRVADQLRASDVEVFVADYATAGRIFEQWAPDVISAHGAPPSVFAAAEAAHVPFVENLHGMYSVFAADWHWHRDVWRGGALAAIVVVSDLLGRDYLAGNPEFPAERLVAIPNAVAAPEEPGDRSAVRKRLGLSSEFLFVSLGRYVSEKNAYGLISAFADTAMRCPDAHLVVAGHPQDPRYLRKVLRLRDTLPCADRVHVRGHASNLGGLLAAADGFVHDSYHEGGPLVTMEALCAGVPIVVSEVGSAREQVGEDPARGYVVTNPNGAPLPMSWDAVAAGRFRPQVNRAELADRMAALVAGREQYSAARDQLAAESRQRFAADLSLAKHASVLTAVARRAPLPAPANARS
jgi:glycosyltransferase involved in cell wall biosynthesis